MRDRSGRNRTRNVDDEIHMTNATGVVLAASTATWLVNQLSDIHVMAGFANRFLWLSGDRKRPLPYRPRIRSRRSRSFKSACAMRSTALHEARSSSSARRSTCTPAENLSSLCVWCHLLGVHGGRIRALPPASNVRWMLGERPILIVHGRHKREVDQAA